MTGKTPVAEGFYLTLGENLTDNSMPKSIARTYPNDPRQLPIPIPNL